MAKLFVLATALVISVLACTAPETASPNVPSAADSIRPACLDLAKARRDLQNRCKTAASDLPEDEIACELNGAGSTSEIRACIARLAKADCANARAELDACRPSLTPLVAVEAAYKKIEPLNVDPPSGPECSLGPKFDIVEHAHDRVHCSGNTYCNPEFRVCTPVGLEVGAKCYGQCASGMWCEKGRCEKIPSRGSCLGDGFCNAAEYCLRPKEGELKLGEGRCVPAHHDRKAGEPCTTGGDRGDRCAEGLCAVDESSKYTQLGTCRMDVGHLGQPCVNGFGGECVAPSTCTYTTGRRPAVCALPAHVGEVCEYLPGCVAGAYCRDWAPTHPGRCVAFAHEGERCSHEAKEPLWCEKSLSCTHNRCTR